MPKRIHNIIAAFFIILLSMPLAFGRVDDSQEKARLHYEAGNTFYNQGKYKEAEEEYQRALELLSLKKEEMKPEAVSQPKAEEEKETAKEQIPQEARAAVKPRASLEYLIGEEDVLQINVWQNQDLDQEAIVRPDGKISFPLIGEIQASGMTITELGAELTRRLKEFIKYPQVSISLKRMGGRRVVVLGEVSNPGVYSVTGTRTILEAIGMAGGFSKDSVASSTILIRGPMSKPLAQRINLSSALKFRGDAKQNVALESGDVIFVPKKFIANVNYFLDQVLDPISKGLYTAKAIQTWGE